MRERDKKNTKIPILKRSSEQGFSAFAGGKIKWIMKELYTSTIIYHGTQTRTTMYRSAKYKNTSPMPAI